MTHVDDSPVRTLSPRRWARARQEASDVQIAGAMFAAFAAQDRERMLALAHPRVVVDGGHLAERTGRTDLYLGHDGLKDLLSDLARVWEELEVTPRESRRVGRAVLMTATLAAHSQGATLTGSVAWIYRMRRRKVVSIEVFRCREDALAAIDGSAGASEL